MALWGIIPCRTTLAGRWGKLKAISILIGEGAYGEEVLTNLTDYFFKISDLTEDSKALQKAFAV
jgi:hypothetical protein